MINNLWSAIKHSNLLRSTCLWDVFRFACAFNNKFITCNITRKCSPIFHFQNVNNLKITIYGFDCLHLIASKIFGTNIALSPLLSMSVIFFKVTYQFRCRQKAKPINRLYGLIDFYGKTMERTEYRIKWWWSIVFHRKNIDAFIMKFSRWRFAVNQACATRLVK